MSDHATQTNLASYRLLSFHASQSSHTDYRLTTFRTSIYILHTKYLTTLHKPLCNLHTICLTTLHKHSHTAYKLAFSQKYCCIYCTTYKPTSSHSHYCPHYTEKCVWLIYDSGVYLSFGCASFLQGSRQIFSLCTHKREHRMSKLEKLLLPIQSVNTVTMCTHTKSHAKRRTLQTSPDRHIIHACALDRCSES